MAAQGGNGGGYQGKGGIPPQGHQMMYSQQGQGQQPMQGGIPRNYPQSMMMPHMSMQPNYGSPGMSQQMMHQSQYQQHQHGGMMAASHNQMIGNHMMMHPQQHPNMGGTLQQGMNMNQDYQMGQQSGSQQSTSMPNAMGLAPQGQHGMSGSGYSNYSNMHQGMQNMGQPMQMTQPVQQQPIQPQQMSSQMQQMHPHQIQVPQQNQQVESNVRKPNIRLQQPNSQQNAHMQQPLSNQGMLQPMSNQSLQQPLSQQALQQSQSKSPMVPIMTQQHTPQSLQMPQSQMTPQMIQPQSIPGPGGPLSVGPSTQAPMSQGPPLSVNPATPGSQSHEVPKPMASIAGAHQLKQNFIHSKALDESAKNKQPVIQDCIIAGKRLIQYDLRATHFEYTRKVGESIRSENENFEEVRRARDDFLAVCDHIETSMTTVMEAYKQMNKVDKVFEREKGVSMNETSAQLAVISNYNTSTRQLQNTFHRTVSGVSSLLKRMRKRQQLSQNFIPTKKRYFGVIDD